MLAFPRPPNEDPCSSVKRSDNPPASKATLTPGLCLTGAPHTRTHMANPSLLPKRALPLRSEPRTDVTNYLLVLSSKVRPTRVEIRVLSVSTTDRVSPLGGRDHEATWWEKRRGLHRKPSKGWHFSSASALIGINLGRAPSTAAGWKLGVGLNTGQASHTRAGADASCPVVSHTRILSRLARRPSEAPRASPRPP